MTATTQGSPRPSVFSRLYTGTGAFDVVGRRRTWYIGFGLLLLVCVVSIVFRGFNLGIDFTGGTQIQFPAASASTATAQSDPESVRAVYERVIGEEEITVQQAGTGDAASFLIRSDALEPAELVALKQALFDTFQPLGADGTPSAAAISDSAVSGTWGGQITTQAIIALAVFLVLVTLFLALYFERSMAVAALVALMHDVVVTAGIYSIVGFEVSPSTVIGLLTILGFSLYDTVVVFDKVKENTANLLGLTRQTYSESANLALNQTLMRSINTSLIAVLPVVGLMVIGVGLLGVGTLADLALVQMVGIVVGALSSLLLATPMLVDLKMRDPRFQEQARRVAARRAKAAQTMAGGGSEVEAEAAGAGEAPSLSKERAMASAAVSDRAAVRPSRPSGKASRPSGKRSR